MNDQLAGNNSSGHNLITDPRILGWVTSNELDVSNETILNWNLQVVDHIRSLGSKVMVASPNVSGDNEFGVTLPLFNVNVDYVNIHSYLLSKFYNNSHIMDHTSFFTLYKSYLETAVVQPTLQNGYSLNQVILGEFGLWIGPCSDQRIAANFTNEEKAVYYQAVLDAAKAEGTQNVLLFIFFAQIGSDGTYLTPNYDIMDTSSTIFYPNLKGIINNAYCP